MPREARAGGMWEEETLMAIREGIASANRGELKPAEQILAEMKAKYGNISQD